MPVRVSNRPTCRNCNGFSSVSITTGDRHRDGSRVLLRVVCPTCQGTGHTHPATITQAGR
ncbi:hypothetical protein ACFWWT_18145 [Streptomyces sp. NPDC058676]|uniref:hypothetical protein n=1 Tax=unclassified Streptomyces TaxID=2593676 RepID=UPI00364D0A11